LLQTANGFGRGLGICEPQFTQVNEPCEQSNTIIRNARVPEIERLQMHQSGQVRETSIGEVCTFKVQ